MKPTAKASRTTYTETAILAEKARELASKKPEKAAVIISTWLSTSINGNQAKSRQKKAG